MLSNPYVKYNLFWSESCFMTTYNTIKKTGTYLRSSQRKIPMYLFGSTIGASQFPQYLDSNGHHNLPRPYRNYKPGSPARAITDSHWFTEFAMDVEKCVIEFLKEIYPYHKKAELTLFLMATAKAMIPQECRISNTAFNHMTLLGNLNHESSMNIGAHIDDQDIVTALFHVGKPIKGGETHYYSGKSKKEKGDVMICVPFKHGRLQVGFFDDTVHCATNWEGIRGGINFNLKKNVLSFFMNKKLRKYYDQYAEAGFPLEDFVAI